MSENCRDYRKRPIPDLSEARECRRISRSIPIAHDHPLSFEELVDIRDYGIPGENYYHMEADNPPYNGSIRHSIPHILVRKSVARRLLVVAETLRLDIGAEPYGLDGYRDIRLQGYMFDEWMPEYVRVCHPDWDAERRDAEVRMFWAKGTDDVGRVNPLSPPPHSTGGAIDFTIRSRRTGAELNMGCGFDDFSCSHAAFLDHYETLRSAGKILTLDEEEALRNRRILYWTQRREGFVLNPNEVWHAELYTKLWAAIYGEEFAYYPMAFAPFAYD